MRPASSFALLKRTILPQDLNGFVDRQGFNTIAAAPGYGRGPQKRIVDRFLSCLDASQKQRRNSFVGKYCERAWGGLAVAESILRRGRESDDIVAASLC